ncbi:MAG: amidohydrolase family protein [Desulfitobacterium sp.]|nr:amidohydrolase family protein [Desulfitobacterium sp.]
MNISCSGEGKVLIIPQSGAAVLGGSWSSEKGCVKESLYLEWQEGKVRVLRPLKKEEKNWKSSQELFSWENYILMPGFIDTHVHLALDSVDFTSCLERWSDNLVMEIEIRKHLQQYLEYGIVAIRDGGDLPGYGWLAREHINEGQWCGPFVISVREAVAKKGMYGRFLGRGFLNLDQWLMEKEEFFRQGTDQLKVIVTGIISFKEYGKVGPVQWSEEELREIVDSAHELGKTVMAHASGEEGIRRAIGAGVDSIEHGYYITSEQLAQLKEKGIAWVPTVAPIGNILKYPSERYSSLEIENLNKILRGHLASICEAYELGVKLGIGTDAGAYLVPHGKSFWDELEWMREGGIPQEEILRMATRENAQLCGLTDFGKLEIGTPLMNLQLADFSGDWFQEEKDK